MNKLIALNDDMVKLIPFIDMDFEDDDVITLNRNFIFNTGSNVYDGIAMILGKGELTKDELGKPYYKYDEELMNYFDIILNYFKDNILYIEQIIHQFSIKGGVTPGVYRTDMKDMIWERREESDEEIAKLYGKEN